MISKFSGAEVIQLAISMEEEGVKFYEKYAAMADVELKEVLLGMAEDERQHAKVFQDMYKELEVDEASSDYLFEASTQEFFSSYAKSEGFNRDIPTIDSVKDAIKVGAETERVTINYYKSLLPHVNDAVKAVLNRLIEEEETHLVRLEDLLK